MRVKQNSDIHNARLTFWVGEGDNKIKVDIHFRDQSKIKNAGMFNQKINTIKSRVKPYGENSIEFENVFTLEVHSTTPFADILKERMNEWGELYVLLQDGALNFAKKYYVITDSDGKEEFGGLIIPMKPDEFMLSMKTAIDSNCHVDCTQDETPVVLEANSEYPKRIERLIM